MVERICKKKLEKNPYDKDALWVIGNLYVNYKKFDKAKRSLEALYAVNNNTKSVAMLLSRVYYNLSQYDKVREVLEKIEIKEKEPAAYYLGVSLIEGGRAKKGIGYLEKYLVHHPKDYNVHWKLGYEYFRLNEYEKAIDSYVEARKLKPNKKIDEAIKICYERLRQPGRP